MRHLGCYDFHRLHGSYTRCYSIVGSVILRRLLYRILSNACSLPRYTRRSVRIWDIGQKNGRPDLHTYQWCGRSNMHTSLFSRSFPVSAVQWHIVSSGFCQYTLDLIRFVLAYSNHLQSNGISAIGSYSS